MGGQGVLWSRCCARDEGLALRSRPSGEASLFRSRSPTAHRRAALLRWQARATAHREDRRSFGGLRRNEHTLSTRAARRARVGGLFFERCRSRRYRSRFAVAAGGETHRLKDGRLPCRSGVDDGAVRRPACPTVPERNGPFLQARQPRRPIWASSVRCRPTCCRRRARRTSASASARSMSSRVAQGRPSTVRMAASSSADSLVRAATRATLGGRPVDA